VSLTFKSTLQANAALKAVHGKDYEVGCIPCLLYIASGGSLDWALGDAGIPYSMAMELRDTGLYGFLLPPEQIIPTGEETWAFHKSAGRQIIEEFGTKN
jgi:murein tripeptide amidase MpaA